MRRLPLFDKTVLRLPEAIALIFCLLLLSGCSQLFPYDYPEAALPSPSPIPSQQPIVLPSPAPQTHMFGIAYSKVSRFAPLTDNLRYNDQVARLCYEGLFELDETFTPVPLLCAGMETDDHRTFRFTLREGVTFYDTTPLTAADVVYSIGQARTEGGPYTKRLSCIAGVSAENGVVVVEMTEPVWNAAALFDFPIVKESTAAVAIGTGPYRIVFSYSGDYLLASGDWWQGKPLSVSRIDLIPAEDADTLVFSFQYGYIAMLQTDPWDTFSPVINSGYEQVMVPTGLTQFIAFNLDREPLSNLAFRRALALALDRQGMVAEIYGPDATASALPVPPWSGLYTEPNASRYQYNPEGAGSLATPGTALTMIVGAENAARVRMAEYAAESFRDAGFDVTVRTLGWRDFEAAVREGDFDLCYAEAQPAPNYDPREFLLPGGAFYFCETELPAVTEAAAQLVGSGDTGLNRLWNAVYDDLPVLTVCFRKEKFLSQRGLLSNQTPTFGNPFHNFADWTVTRES
ncbi:MAG: ABC transporter substrate-binding protein [Oscillospiraceae bacterium]|nr:ABC transporter substrate-binding protein [Oscillospiraceae bacterium]